MPVPKRKTSKARRDKRQSCKFIRPKAFCHCSNCEAPLNPHQACLTCGFYKGKKVLTTKQDRLTARALQAQKTPSHKAEEDTSEAAR